MNRKPRLLIVFGTRPEAIKMAPVVRGLAQEPAFDVRVCVTAQHRELLDQGLGPFGLRPDYDLNLMRRNQDLGDLTGAILRSLETVFSAWLPDRVIVHGDTTTAFAAALAASYRKIPVAHVEAGLRTGNASSPWPEEMNRRLIDAMADVHFAPTDWAARNLFSEGRDPARIIVTGNTVIDALFSLRTAWTDDPGLKRTLAAQYPFLDDRPVVLVTGHRRENFGKGLEHVCRALRSLAGRGDVQIVFSVHLNPNVRGPVTRMLEGREAIHLIGPQGYLHFLYLMNKSRFIITDSGGIQEEAPALGKPVLVTRHGTERPEAVNAGAVRVVGLDPETIVREAGRLLDDGDHYDRMAKVPNPYGDGSAAARIVNVFKEFYAIGEPEKVEPLASAFAV